MICPRCHSDAKTVLYMGTSAIVCDSCGYDERQELELLPGNRPTAKQRGPYRAGGAQRTQK